MGWIGGIAIALAIAIHKYLQAAERTSSAPPKAEPEPEPHQTPREQRAADRPFWTAVCDNNLDEVRRILDAGEIPSDSSLVVGAIDRDRADALRLFLERGESAKCVGSHGRSALHIAVEPHYRFVPEPKHRLELVRLLLDAGADPNAPGPSGITPTRIAISTDLGVLKLLLAAGGDLGGFSEHGYGPVGAAAIAGNVDTTKYLLSLGMPVDPPHEVEHYSSPLYRAITRDFKGIVELLLPVGAVATDWGHPVKMLFCAAQNNAPGVIEALVGFGLNLEERGEGGRTPLLEAILRLNAKAVREFIHQGSSLRARDDAGRSVFDLAKLAWANAAFQGELGVMRKDQQGAFTEILELCGYPAR